MTIELADGTKLRRHFKLPEEDVECLDLHLLDHDRRSAVRGCGVDGKLKQLGRRELTLQPLQGPRAGLGDRCRDRGEGHDPSDVGHRARERKAGHVVLDSRGPGLYFFGCLRCAVAIEPGDNLLVGCARAQVNWLLVAQQRRDCEGHAHHCDGHAGAAELSQTEHVGGRAS